MVQILYISFSFSSGKSQTILFQTSATLHTLRLVCVIYSCSWSINVRQMSVRRLGRNPKSQTERWDRSRRRSQFAFGIKVLASTELLWETLTGWWQRTRAVFTAACVFSVHEEGLIISVFLGLWFVHRVNCGCFMCSFSFLTSGIENIYKILTAIQTQTSEIKTSDKTQSVFCPVNKK